MIDGKSDTPKLELVLDPETGTRMTLVGKCESKLYTFWLNPVSKIVKCRDEENYKKDPATGWTPFEVSEEAWLKIKDSSFIVDFVEKWASQ
jgi:hypothetical protein